ncbi:C-type lectin domain family 6 member A [Amphibalanus amphitrite]|uniref:C-type lectin domain family 6 member A n=1 Tax=Amphibalanus amphitrite TaxID=1232801 RepID=A0A6A4VVV8_AMPAM|nr:C-type lectin domain family 6 member A [Amphibalanus amphitrite]
MARPGAVLLLLLVTSAAAARYRWLDPVSLHGPAVQTVSAVSAVDCGRRCDAQTIRKCSGFIYRPDDGTCRLFSGDCRGPAANSSQLITERYMARSGCPVNYTTAESRCTGPRAHLAVPRSDAEQSCALQMIGDQLAWLGLTDVDDDGVFIGADGCGVATASSPFWAPDEPDSLPLQYYAVLAAAPSGFGEGWHDNVPDQLRYPLCQLPACYRPDCV